MVGFYPAGAGDEIRVDPKQIIHFDGNLLAAANHLRVNEIIVAVKERRGGAIPLRELLDCKMAGIKVLDLSSFFERVRGQVRIDSLRASWLIYGEGFRQGWSRTLVKRVFDIVASLLLLVLAAPVMLLAALLIVIEDGAPVFYRQERVGLGGRLFKVTKFRSMRRDAERDGKPRWAGRQRRPGDPGRPLHPQVPHRRAAAAVQRAQGRHEPGGPASRSAPSSSMTS